MDEAALEGDFKHHVFISYSNDPDYQLSRKIESFLEGFHKLKTPEDVKLTPLSACRDGSDFSLHQQASGAVNLKERDPVKKVLVTHLAQCQYLLVLCSKNSGISEYVKTELRWFLDNRGSDHVLLAVTEGSDLSLEGGQVFSELIIHHGLHKNIFYDLRGFKKASRNWLKVRDPLEELTNIAALLNRQPSGRILPLWRQEERKRLLRQRYIAIGTSIVLVMLSLFAFIQRNTARQNATINLSNFQASEALRLADQDARLAAQHALVSYKLNRNFFSEKAILTAFYKQPYYEMVEDLTFDGTKTLRPKETWVSITINPSINEVAALTRSGMLRIYDLKTSQRVDSVLFPRGAECVAPYGKEGYVVGSSDGTVKILRRARREISVLGSIRESITGIQIDTLRNILMLTCGNQVKLFSFKNNRLSSFDTITMPSTITLAKFIGEKVFLTSYNTEVVLYNLKRKRIDLRKHIDNLVAANLFADTLTYVTSSVAFIDSLHIVALNSGSRYSLRMEGTEHIMMDAVISDDKHILAQYNDLGLQIWDRFGNKLLNIKGSINSTSRFLASPDFSFVYTTDLSGQLKKWRINSFFSKSKRCYSFETCRSEVKKSQITSIINSFEDKHLIQGLKRKIDSRRSGSCIDVMNIYSIRNYNNQCTFYSSDGKKIKIEKWNHRRKKFVLIDSLILNYYDQLVAIGVNNNILVAYSGADLILWDLETRKSLQSIDIGDRRVYSIDVSSNGKVVVCYYDVMSIYDSNGVHIYDIPIPFSSSYRVEEVLFSATGGIVFTRLTNGDVWEWPVDAATISVIIQKRLE